MDLVTLSHQLILFQIFYGHHKTSTCPLKHVIRPTLFLTASSSPSLHCSLLDCLLPWQDLLILIQAQTTFTCVSLPWLKDVIIGPNGLPDSVSDCIVSHVVSVWDAKQFPKESHLSGLQFLYDARCQCSGFAGIQLYWENQGEHKSDLWA